MGRCIFTFVFGFFLLCLWDRFIGRSRPRGWFVNWRPNLVMAALTVFVSLFINMILGR